MEATTPNRGTTLATVTSSIEVKATPERTFAAFTDLRNAAGRVRGIKKLDVLTEGPIGKGTRFRETRVMFGREATEEMEITDFQPGRSYTVGGISCGAEFATTFRFVPADGGTRVDIEMAIRPISLFAKLMSPLSGMMMGPMKKCVETDMDDMRKIAEAG